MQDKGDDDWMTRYFFSGGTMVSAGLLYHFQVLLQFTLTSTRSRSLFV